MKRNTLSMLGCLNCHANLHLVILGNMFQFASIPPTDTELLFASGLSNILFGECIKLKAAHKTIHREGK